MRIHFEHRGEDYVGVSFSTGKQGKRRYAEVSLKDWKIINNLINVQKMILDNYPDNDFVE